MTKSGKEDDDNSVRYIWQELKESLEILFELLIHKNKKVSAVGQNFLLSN